MTWNEMIASDNVLVWAAGLAGAAAMAATDWRSPWRLVQHIFVGFTASLVATPLIFPILGKLLTIISVPPDSQEMSAGFMTGAFAIYLFEYILAFWKAKMAPGAKLTKDGGDDER